MSNRVVVGALICACASMPIGVSAQQLTASEIVLPSLAVGLELDPSESLNRVDATSPLNRRRIFTSPVETRFVRLHLTMSGPLVPEWTLRVFDVQGTVRDSLRADRFGV